MVLQSYVSEAVNRFFTPQPADPVSSHPNSPNGSEAGGKPPDCGLTQDNAIYPSEEEDEQRPDARVSLLSLSSATVAWKVCPKDLKSDEEQGHENEESEDGRRREEDLDQVGNDHLDAEPTGNQVEQTEIKHSYACEQSGASENDQKRADAGSATDGTVGKRMETSDEEPGADEESKTQDDHQIGNEATAETQLPEDVEEDLEDEEQVCTTTDEENSKPEEGVDTDDAAPMLKMKNANLCEGVCSENTNRSEERQTQVENQPSVCDVSQNKQVVSEQENGGEHDERVPAAAATEEEDIREAAQTQTEDKEPETETIQDGRQEEIILTQCLTRSEDAEQKTQQEAAELAGAEEDVLVTIMQTTETEVTSRRFLDKDQVTEWPASEVDNKESYVENVCTSGTVKAEAAQEVGREFKNILQPISEGQAAELRKLNTDVSGETREGVPEHNNEREADENKTQRLWEGGNCGEIHVAPLPEEVEAGEQASLKISGMGAGYLLERGILEVAGDDSEFDLTEELTERQHLAQDTEEPQTGQENLESEFLFEEEDVELPENSMKVQFKLLGKELETNVETDSTTTEELQDGVKTPVDAKEAAGDDEERKEDAAADEGAEFAEELPCFFEAGVKTSAETSLSLKSVQSTHTDQKSEGTSSSPEEKTTSVVLQQIEMKLSGDCSVDILRVGLDPNEKDSTDEEEKDDKTQDANEIPPLQLETTDELVKTQKDVSRSPLRALRMQEMTTITNTEAADDPDTAGATDRPETSAENTEETSRLIADRPDVIDEELLDLWIEEATSKDVDMVEEEDGFEIQNDTTEHPLKEESGEISASEKELLMEPHSVEHTSSDAEMSSTLEPELLDQTQPRPTESLEDLPNMVAADLSDLSALDSESQAVPMEETAEPVEFSLREEDPSRAIESCSASGVSASEEKHLHGESEQSEEPDRGTGTTVWRNTEEADVTLLIDIDVHFQAETRVEDESVNDVLFEKESVLIEHPEHWTEAEKYQMSLDHRTSGDFTESLLELGRAEVAEEQEIAFEDWDEVLFLIRSIIHQSYMFL